MRPRNHMLNTTVKRNFEKYTWVPTVYLLEGSKTHQNRFESQLLQCRAMGPSQILLGAYGSL